jgi:hypothetical protein
MKYKTIKNTFYALAVLMLTSCGGGSGGGSSSKGVRVLHGSIDAPPVDLFSTGKEEILQSARFAQAVEFRDGGGDGQTIALTRTGASVSIFREDVNFKDTPRISVLVYNTNEAGGVLFNAIKETLPEKIESGTSVVQFIHSVHGAGTVDVSINGSLVAGSVPFGSSSGYISVPAETALNILIQRTVDKKTLTSGSNIFPDRKPSTILATGEEGFFVTATQLDG